MAKLVRLLLAVAALTVAIAVAGCPEHEVSILLSLNGTGFLITACTAPLEMDCRRTVAPGMTSHARPDFVLAPLQARLFLLSPTDEKVRDASKCMTIAPCANMRTRAACLAFELNQQLDGAIPTGLSFDGLRTLEQAELLLALYQPTSPTADEAPCADDNLIACAGLAPPLGGGNFDITCASCQGGPRPSPGRDTTPCPSPSECFLQQCDAILRAN